MIVLNNLGFKSKGFMSKMLTRYKLSNKEPPKINFNIKI